MRKRSVYASKLRLASLLRLRLLLPPSPCSTAPPAPSQVARSIHSGAKCTAFIHLMPTFIVSKSFSASYQFASEAPSSGARQPQLLPELLLLLVTPAGAGNKRVTIVSVRLSLIMKTAATLSLENAFTITDCLAPAWNVTLLSMRLHLFSRQAGRQAAASFRSPIAAAIKICSYWLWEEEEQAEEGDAGRE